MGFSSEVFLLCSNLRIIESLQNWVSKFVNLSTDVNIPEMQKKKFLHKSLNARIGPLNSGDKIIFILTYPQYIVHITQRFTKI